MTVLREFIQNRILWAAAAAWFIAQGMKVIIELIRHKRMDFRRLIGSGGMPSSHTAFVVGLAVATGQTEGWDSALFAVACCFAIVVMSDAAGVRRAAGKQAAVLNRVTRRLIEKGDPPGYEALRELLGHTPLQVVAGGVVGIAVALLMRTAA